MTDLTTELKTIFGFDGFKAGQEPVIEKILAGQSALAIFPTGSGKSLCYQLPATALPHLTLVVSPLLALMKDQLGFLRKHDIPAASLDSTLTYEEYQKVVQDLRENRLKVLMVSVERFKNERFRLLMENIPISLLVIDEAHCISEWGHNFRPDYLKLPRYQSAFNIPQVLLLTATATAKVKRDIAAKFSIAADNIVQTGFYRSNLNLNVQAVTEQDKPPHLVNLVQQQGRGCGIVYVTLQQTAERVAAALKAHGIAAKPYHAGMNDEERKLTQEHFMSGETPVVVATIAFGMGVDKPDIRFVIHYDLPKSIENYSQEIGRAGRDGMPANCYVLGNLHTLTTLENFVYGDMPERHGISIVINAIKTEVRGGQWEVQLHALSKASNIRLLTLKTLLVQLEMHGALTPSHTYTSDYAIKLLVPEQDIVQKFEQERRIFVEHLFKVTAFKKTWGRVDFDRLYQSYGAPRKRAISALEYFRDNGWLEIKTSGNTEVYTVNTQVLDQPEVDENLHQIFKQHADTEIARIAQLLGFLQSESCLSYDLARYFDDRKAPEHCGHCSCCDGQPASFPPAETASVALEDIKTIATQLQNHLAEKGVLWCSNELVAQYLVGINMPVFTQTQAKKAVKGFGLAETVRYHEVLAQLQSTGQMS